MTESPVDVAAIKADHQGGLPIGGGGSIHFCSGGWVEIMDAEEPCEVYRLADALDRAQAASEGVDLLIAQAERRGAVKALRRFRDRFDSFDDPHDNAIVAAIADEDADAIERGSL